MTQSKRKFQGFADDITVVIAMLEFREETIDNTKKGKKSKKSKK